MKNEPFNLENEATDKEPRPPDHLICNHIQAMRADTEDHDLWLSKFNPGNVYFLTCDDCTGPMTEKALNSSHPEYGPVVLEWRKPHRMITEPTLLAYIAAREEIIAVSERMKKAMPTLQEKAAKQFKN